VIGLCTIASPCKVDIRFGLCISRLFAITVMLLFPLLFCTLDSCIAVTFYLIKSTMQIWLILLSFKIVFLMPAIEDVLKFSYDLIFSFGVT
jgi:hypothetical protein